MAGRQYAVTPEPGPLTNRVCAACTATCPAGQGLERRCEGTQDSRCVVCGDGTYSAGAGDGPCLPCVQTCASGYFLVGECTSTTTPTCRRCATADSCAPGEYLLGACEGRTQPACTSCTACMAGEYAVRPCLQVAAGGNRQCGTCTVASDCDAGKEFLAGRCQGAETPVCRQCTTPAECGPHGWLDGECAVDKPNPVCRACTVCTDEEYPTQACTATQDRVCAKCLTDVDCAAGTFLTGQCPGATGGILFGGRTVVAGGLTYATLDGTDPTDSRRGCQEGPLRLPDGWTRAEDGLVARDVVAASPWGTMCQPKNEKEKSSGAATR